MSHALTLKGELTLEVYTENDGAMSFYRRPGFQEISRRPFDQEGFPLRECSIASGLPGWRLVRLKQPPAIHRGRLKVARLLPTPRPTGGQHILRVEAAIRDETDSR
jgi:hypothetical protein